MHPTFRTLESTLQTKDADYQKAIEQAKAEARAEVDLANLKAKAIQARSTFNAVIPDDARIAAAMEHLYMEGLKGVTTKVVDGKPELWKEGKRIENDKLFPLTEEEFFKSLVEGSYTTKVSDQKTGSGLPPGAGQQQQSGAGAMTHYKGELPKDKATYDKLIVDKSIPFEARKEVRAYWEKQQQAA